MQLETGKVVMNTIQKSVTRPKIGNTALEYFRQVRFPQDSIICANPSCRYIYWPNSPAGGIGVSFVDPNQMDLYGGDMEDYGFFEQCSFEYSQFAKGSVCVTRIAKESDSELGRALSVEQLCPFSGLDEHWRRAKDKCGKPCEDVLVSWTRTHKEWVCEDSDLYGRGESYVLTETNKVALNDYTNRAFNYLYIRKLMASDILLRRIEKERFFTDGALVNQRVGYDSPAYAVALCESLRQHGLLNVAMQSFSEFVHYHPVDPIVTMCEIAAEKRFENIVLLDERDRVVRAGTHEDDEEDLIEDDKSEREDPYYVDDCPVYGAEDQEDAEMLYWNTH